MGNTKNRHHTVLVVVCHSLGCRKNELNTIGEDLDQGVKFQQWSLVFFLFTTWQAITLHTNPDSSSFRFLSFQYGMPVPPLLFASLCFFTHVLSGHSFHGIPMLIVSFVFFQYLCANKEYGSKWIDVCPREHIFIISPALTSSSVFWITFSHVESPGIDYRDPR